MKNSTYLDILNINTIQKPSPIEVSSCYIIMSVGLFRCRVPSIFECADWYIFWLRSLLLLLNLDMEEYSYTLTKEGVMGLLIILAGSYFFGFLGFLISFVVSIGIITLLSD